MLRRVRENFLSGYPTISLWIGERLSKLGLLTVHSFVGTAMSSGRVPSYRGYFVSSPINTP
jgi:hypothetical protein